MKTHEDFRRGERVVTPRRTITETHVVTFAGLTGDDFPLHVDEEHARGTPFGRRLVQGPLVYATAAGLVFQSGILGDAVIAFLGAERLRHLAPCYIGETIGVTATVLDSRPTQDGGRGVVSLRYDVDGVQDGDVRRVMEVDATFLVHGVGSGDAHQPA